jgi:hypothetical protein
MARPAWRICQLRARQRSDAQRRGLGALFHLQALVLGVQAPRLGLRGPAR